MRIIQVTPEELTNLISEALDNKLNEILHNVKPEPKIEYLSRKETSKILGVSTGTLNNWRKSGILEPDCIGKRVLYTRQAIDKKIAS
jgi:DNA-directed RNA polymerase specialized sigma subunit